MSDFMTVAKLSELPPGEMKAIKCGKRLLGLANVDGEVFAFDDTCTHELASLTEGELFGESVECPLHGAAFNIRTGAVESFPAIIPLPVYEVRVVGDEIQVTRAAAE